MARTGLHKSEVKKARDSLVSQGINPSVDALRVALGNTGSKTTIHKYLKELEEEGEGSDLRKASVSEALMDFVGRLSVQLQEEAHSRVVEIESQSRCKDLQHEAVVDSLTLEITGLSSRLKLVDAEVLQGKSAYALLNDEFNQEKFLRHSLEQKGSDLVLRLAENERHRLSLEEKHQHARDALEHYRASVKEQRDQDQRRHEQQIQQLQAEMRQLRQSLVIKQDDVTRLNQEGVRLVADLSHAQNNLHDQQSRNRQLERKLETLQAIEQLANTTAQRLGDKESQLHAQKEQLSVSTAKAETLDSTVRELQLALATAHAKMSAQQEVAAEIRSYLNAREQTIAAQSGA